MSAPNFGAAPPAVCAQKAYLAASAAARARGCVQGTRILRLGVILISVYFCENLDSCREEWYNVNNSGIGMLIFARRQMAVRYKKTGGKEQ